MWTLLKGLLSVMLINILLFRFSWTSEESFYCACRPGFTGKMCEGTCTLTTNSMVFSTINSMFLFKIFLNSYFQFPRYAHIYSIKYYLLRQNIHKKHWIRNVHIIFFLCYLFMTFTISMIFYVLALAIYFL